jgi:hypothetical protein
MACTDARDSNKRRLPHSSEQGGHTKPQSALHFLLVLLAHWVDMADLHTLWQEFGIPQSACQDLVLKVVGQQTLLHWILLF